VNQPGPQDGRGKELAEFEAQVASTDGRNRDLVASLRETAKWIVSGVAVTAGGVIAGSSLTSLGSLDLGPRLALAAGSALVGFVALGRALWMAIEVLLPRTYDMAALVGDGTLGRDRVEVLDLAARDAPDGSPKIDDVVRDYRRRASAYAAAQAQGKVDPGEQAILVATAAHIRSFLSNAGFHHQRIMFLRLRRNLFVLGAVVASAFGVFAWAANPGKDGPADVTPIARELEVLAEDRPAIERAIGQPGCVGERLRVVIHRRWQSGIQEAISVPYGECRAARFILDQGRLQPAG
jgi:hypothetical protein